MLPRGLPKSVVPRARSFPSQWFEMFLGHALDSQGFHAGAADVPFFS